MKEIFFSLLIVLLLAGPLLAETFFVGQGESIQDALNSAEPTDVIILTGTSYPLQQTLTIPRDNLTLKSGNQNPEDCIIDGNNSVNILDINNVDGFVMENICIQNGFSNNYSYAAGITYTSSSMNTINNCIIRNCTGSDLLSTGGIRSRTSTITINNSIIYGNVGGGYGFMDYRVIGSGYEEDLIISNSVIYNNQGTYRGGVYGLCHTGVGHLSIDECLFYNNTGGAISWSGNNDFSLYQQYVNISNTTIKDNIGSSYGVKVNNNPNYEVNLQLKNCIIRDNSNIEIPISEHTIVKYSNVQGGYSGTGNIDADPLFVDPGNASIYNNIHGYTHGYDLTIGSPCIDTGDPTSPLDPDDTIIDMGCYYFHHDYDIKRFEEGIQWVSFPYLNQQGIYNGNMFEQAYYENGLPGLLQLTSGGGPTINNFLRIVGYRDGFDVFIEYIGDEFHDNEFDNMLFRHEGYKIEVDEGSDPTILIVDGNRLESYTLAEMPALQKFWLGYYTPYPQNIEDAFGDEFHNVNRVWAEDWYYDAHKSQCGFSGTLPSNSTIGKTMEYGKMYIVQMYRDVYNFSWNGSGTAEEPTKKSVPENFSYTKKMDYEVIDVVNIPSNVTEIGVFEKDVCVGAIAVEDTCEQILVYCDNANRNSVPFNIEIITGRGLSIPIKDYLVLNQMTGEFEPSEIIPGRQNYSAIKFGGQEEFENTVPSSILKSNYPNPFNPTTTISFSLPNEQVIELTIFNIKGQKVKTIYSGLAGEGEHSITWSGKDLNDKLVSSGIYFYKLKTNSSELTRKMLMIK